MNSLSSKLQIISSYNISFNYSSFIIHIPCKFIPSSVRVPVLSKTIVYTLPATFILGGEIQNIFNFLNLFIAYNVDTVKVEGNAGGTVTVIKSKKLVIKLAVEY